jgi:hypothetical protein
MFFQHFYEFFKFNYVFTVVSGPIIRKYLKVYFYIFIFMYSKNIDEYIDKVSAYHFSSLHKYTEGYLLTHVKHVRGLGSTRLNSLELQVAVGNGNPKVATHRLNISYCHILKLFVWSNTTYFSPSGHQARLLTGRFQPFAASQSLGTEGGMEKTTFLRFFDRAQNQLRYWIFENSYIKMNII